MDITQLSSIMGVSSAAAQRVATALAPQSATTQSTAKPKDTTSSTASTADTSDGTTITGTDFLTLLVSELKNQDPTQPTDPTEYITQMVGVNSLQQLIDINQGLSTVEGGATSSTTSS